MKAWIREHNLLITRSIIVGTVGIIVFVITSMIAYVLHPLQTEISETEYKVVVRYSEQFPSELDHFIRYAMRDNKITQSEYQDIRREYNNLTSRETKKQLIEKYSRFSTPQTQLTEEQ